MSLLDFFYNLRNNPNTFVAGGKGGGLTLQWLTNKSMSNTRAHYNDMYEVRLFLAINITYPDLGAVQILHNRFGGGGPRQIITIDYIQCFHRILNKNILWGHMITI